MNLLFLVYYIINTFYSAYFTFIYFSREQCHNLISATYKTSCKTGEGVEEMFTDIVQHLIHSNQSRFALQNFNTASFKIHKLIDEPPDDSCSC